MGSIKDESHANTILTDNADNATIVKNIYIFKRTNCRLGGKILNGGVSNILVG